MRAAKRIEDLRSRPAPFLLTVDVHPRPDLAGDLAQCLDYLQAIKVPSTFFVPAVLILEHGLTAVLRRLVAEGHQLGCHGLWHRPPEDFATDPFETQRTHLAEAKAILEDAVGRSVTAFRAPTSRLSRHTFPALESAGYKADLSVPPQRLGLLSSQPTNLGWMLAPRRPYHPSYTNPFRPGSMGLWEIPLTSFVVPFTSLLYQALGLPVARAYTRVMVAEARLTGGPVDFLLHPEELTPSTYVRPRFPRTLRALRPRSNGGFELRYWLYERDESKIHQATLDFLDFVRRLPAIRYVTVDEYLGDLRRREAATDLPSASSAPT